MEILKQEFQNPTDYLNYCLGLEKKFERGGPQVLSLQLISKSPEGNEVGCRDIAFSTASQCYSGGISEMKSRPGDRANQVLDSTLVSGHHTTRQHDSLTFKILASRAVVHDVLHAGPFYNTSQQSQRYVEAKRGNFVIPTGLSEKERNVFIQAADYANESYFQMLPLLEPEVMRRLGEIYGEKLLQSEERKKIEDVAKKKSQEIARYVLPINQLTVLDYSINELELLRMFRASQLLGTTDESRLLVGQMVREVAKSDPQLLKELSLPVKELYEVPELNNWELVRNKAEFDRATEGKVAKLLAFDSRSLEVAAMAVRNVLGVSRENLGNEEALELLMNPQKNKLLGDVFETAIDDPLGRCLRLINFDFGVKLSLTADSQRQRHRTIAGATPDRLMIFDGEPDYYTPLVIRGHETLENFYDQVNQREVDNVNWLLEVGTRRDIVLYLLPNSQYVRTVERGDLLDHFHRKKLRLCNNAQEEIFFMDLEQSQQLIDEIPQLKNTLKAPCGLRKDIGVKPYCPEGDRWCGETMWNIDIRNYKDNRKI